MNAGTWLDNDADDTAVDVDTVAGVGVGVVDVDALDKIGA